MKSVARLAIFVAFTFGSIWAGGPQRNLVLTRSVPLTSENGSALVLPLRCDQSGNIFVRRYEASHPDTLITILRRDGTSAEWPVDKAPGFRSGAGIVDYFVAADGSVFVLAPNVVDGAFVYVFGPKGDYMRTIKLGELRTASKLAVFPSGKIFVTGIVPGTREHPAAHQPFNALFTSSGTLIKNVQIEGDDQLYKAAENGDSDLVTPGSGTGNRAVSKGMITIGPDGNAYLLRYTRPASVYIISPEGTVLRKFNVGPPDLMPINVIVVRDSIAVLSTSSRGDSAQINLADPLTGEDRASFLPSAEMGAALACFDGEEFTFVGTQEGRMVLRSARPQ